MGSPSAPLPPTLPAAAQLPRHPSPLSRSHHLSSLRWGCLGEDGKRARLPKKSHLPSPCMTRHPKRRRRVRPSTAPPSYAIHYRHCSRFSIQWLYLRHRSVTASLCRATPSDTILPLHFPIDYIDKVVCRSSLILDTALLEFHDSAVRLDSNTNTLPEALEYDTLHPAANRLPAIDSLDHLVGIISLILNDELLDFDVAHTQLDTAI